MIDNPTSLYTAWFDALPQAMRAFVPGATPAAERAADAAAFPADPIGKALQILGDVLPQLYQAYLPLLAKGDLGAETVTAWADQLSASFDTLLASWKEPALFDAPQRAPWAALFPGADGSALPAGAGQLQLGIERSFGGLVDAFGLRPTRELEQAWREMLAAVAAKQRAQAEYLALVVQAWNTGTKRFVLDLQAMGARGERVESLLAFIRLWAKAIDAPVHEAMQGERGLEVTAKLMRAATQYRGQMQKAVALASEILHVPTRAEMDDAYREIEQLKRELDRLRKALPAAAQRRRPKEARP